MNEVSEYLPWTVAKAIEALSLGDSGEFEEPWMAPIQHAAIDYLESLEQALAAAQQEAETWRDWKKLVEAAQQAQREAEAERDLLTEQLRDANRRHIGTIERKNAAILEAARERDKHIQDVVRAESARDAALADLTRAREDLAHTLDCHVKDCPACWRIRRENGLQRAALEATQPHK